MLHSNDPYSPWSQASSWRLNQASVHSFELCDESAQLHRLQLQEIQISHSTALPQSKKYLSQRGQYLFYQSSINLVAADTRLNDFAALQSSQVNGQLDGDRLTAFIDGHKLSLWVALTAQQVTLFLPKTVQAFTIKQPETDTINDDDEHDGKLNAPMNGVIVSLLCKPDQEVNAGDALSQTGLSMIETGSFVSPKRLPQMADSAELFAQITRVPGITYSALTPNLIGLDAAIAANVDEIAMFGAASESFSKKNFNCSIADSLAQFAPLIKRAQAATAGARLRLVHSGLPL
jgi:biotin carboxyl carrier protein